MPSARTRRSRQAPTRSSTPSCWAASSPWPSSTSAPSPRAPARTTRRRLLERHGFTSYGAQRRLELDGWLRLGDTGVEVDRLDRTLFGLAA